MAAETSSQQMSLIPYASHNNEVVLRRGDAVVVYDSTSRQLTARHEDQVCPHCHRPYRDDGREDHGGERPPNSPGFASDRPLWVKPEYFGMLANSRRASPESSGPSTPNARYVQHALRSGQSRDVSGTQDPPSGAEFLGSEPAKNARKGISKSAFSPGYFAQFFQEIKTLGKGGNGVVLLVEHILDGVSLGQFACKRIPVGDDHDWLEKVLLEVKLLQKVSHGNLVAYHWVWLEDYQPAQFGPKIPCLWMLQEFCNGGDLHAYVLRPSQDTSNAAEQLKQKARRRSRADLDIPEPLRGPSRLSFDEIYSFFCDIASGLHHLHSQGYIHRDLKPSNCLLQHDGSKLRVLISDFGEVQAAGAKRASSGATGTISYCAPEVLRRNATDGSFGDFTTKSDIFSLGMIVYFMCFGRLPYRSADQLNEENEDLDQLRAEITTWAGFNDETRARPDLHEKLYKYLKRLLSVDPSARPSTEEIMASIRGGAGLAEMSSVMIEENSSRVSPIDSPRFRPSQGPRKQSTTLTRPGLSSLARPGSTENVHAHSTSDRSSENQSRSRGRSGPTSPAEEGSMIKIPRKVEMQSPEQSPIQKNPQLMLPAPPPKALERNRLERITTHPNVLASFRTLLFLAKVVSLRLPCPRFSINAWLLYPLLGLASIDLGMQSQKLRTSFILLSVHIVVLMMASQHRRLCESHSMTWDDL